MPTHRSRRPFFGLCVLFSLSACIGTEGNGQRADETREFSDFTRIDTQGPFDVDVAHGDAFEVRVSIDSNLLGKLKTSVHDDTLEIDSDGNLFDLLPGPHLIITMPMLSSVRLGGSGNVVARGFDDKVDSLELRASSSGDLTFEGSAMMLTAEVHGSGDMRLSGDADKASLSVSGSGDLDAVDLVAAGATITVDGSGDVRATVNGTADVATNGSGDVDLFGAVEANHVSHRGSGDISVHDM